MTPSERMAKARAVRSVTTRESMARKLLTVDRLERMAKRVLLDHCSSPDRRGTQLGAFTNDTTLDTLSFTIGKDTGKSCPIAMRLEPHTWLVVYRSKSKRRTTYLRGFTVQRVRVFGRPATYYSSARNEIHPLYEKVALSSRAMSLSPFRVHKTKKHCSVRFEAEHHGGTIYYVGPGTSANAPMCSRDEVGVYKVGDDHQRWAAGRGMTPERPWYWESDEEWTSASGAVRTDDGTWYVGGHEFLVEHLRLEPPEELFDWRALGITLTRTQWMEAVDLYFPGDQIARRNALDSIKEVSRMAAECPGMRVHYIWPGFGPHCDRWKDTPLKAAIPTLRHRHFQKPAIEANTGRAVYRMVPTVGLLNQLRVRGISGGQYINEVPGLAPKCPPCIVCTVPQANRDRTSPRNMTLSLKNVGGVQSFVLVPLPGVDLRIVADPDPLRQQINMHNGALVSENLSGFGTVNLTATADLHRSLHPAWACGGPGKVALFCMYGRANEGLYIHPTPGITTVDWCSDWRVGWLTNPAAAVGQMRLAAMRSLLA